MKRLHLILILFILLLVPNAYASEVDVTSNCYGSTGYSSMYNGYEVVYQTNSLYSFGTTYEGQLSKLETELRYNFTANTDYTLTFLTNNTDDFRNTFYTWSVKDVNHNNTELVTGFSFVSMRKVQVTFTTSSATNKVSILIGSRNLSESITGVNNWNIKKVILSSVSSSASQQDVINNQNENTQDIINNNNTNTQDIINNQNENTQDILDSQNAINDNLNSSCKNGRHILDSDFPGDLGWLDSSGNIQSSVSNAVTKYLKVRPNTSYTIRFDGSSSSSSSYCLYNNSKNVISCTAYGGPKVITFTTTSYTTYLRLTIQFARTMSIEGPICNNWEQEGVNAINDYISDDSDPSISNNEINDLFGNVTFNDPLGYLLTLPTRLINQIVLSSNTCNTINLGTLYGVNISFPCINLEHILGSNLWNIIDIISSVSLLAIIFKNLYQTFANLVTLGGEKEAREKFNMPTPMEFLSKILGGDL